MSETGAGYLTKLGGRGHGGARQNFALMLWEEFISYRVIHIFSHQGSSGFPGGDIVQVGFAVVAYRTQSKDDSPKYVCKLVMCTLTLLDTTLSKILTNLQKAYTQRHAIAGPSNPTQTTGVSVMNPLGQKRKEMHKTNDEDEDEVQEARKRFNRMRKECVL
ncbi:hypothetical protein C8R43DRAFT_943257 [Mycena crocata]|nr:hypothetical protein C8R43DRAFT_943257 [Mycena crocata]